MEDPFAFFFWAVPAVLCAAVSAVAAVLSTVGLVHLLWERRESAGVGATVDVRHQRFGAAPRQRYPGAAMAVVVDEPGTVRQPDGIVGQPDPFGTYRA